MAGLVGRRQGCHCNLGTRDFLAGPVGMTGLQLQSENSWFLLWWLVVRLGVYNDKYRGQVAVDFTLSVCFLDACQGTHVYLWAGPFQL